MNCKIFLIVCVFVAAASSASYKYKSRRLFKRADKEMKLQDASPLPSSVAPASSAKPTPITKAPANIHSSIKPSSPKPQVADEGKDKLTTIAAAGHLLNATERPENVSDANENVNKTTPHIADQSTKRPVAAIEKANDVVDGSGHEASSERMITEDDRMVSHDDRMVTPDDHMRTESVFASGSGDHEDLSTEMSKRSSGDDVTGTEIPRSTFKPKCERLADGKKSNEDCIEEKEGSGDLHDDAKKPCCG